MLPAHQDTSALTSTNEIVFSGLADYQSTSIGKDIVQSFFYGGFIDDEMRMTDRVYDLVAKGTPFRDAYNIIKSSEASNAVTKGNKTNSSEGSPFNLNLNKLQKRLNKQKKLK